MPNKLISIRFNLQQGIYKYKDAEEDYVLDATAYDRWTCLDSIKCWFAGNMIPSYQDLMQLRSDFPIINDHYDFTCTDYMNWLISLGEFALVREMLNAGTAQDQNSVSNAVCRGDESFVLELLQGNPERSVRYDIMHPQCAIDLAYERNQMLVVTTMLSMGFESNSDKLYDLVIRDKTKTLHTRMAVMNLLFYFSVPLNSMFFLHALNAPEEAEIRTWFDWGIAHGAPKSCTAVFNSINRFGDKFLPWFKAHHFAMPAYVHHHFLAHPPTGTEQSARRIQALRKLLELWPECSVHPQLLEIPIAAFDLPVAQYLFEECKLQHLSNVEHIIEPFLKDQTREHVDQLQINAMRDWVFTTFKEQIQDHWMEEEKTVGYKYQAIRLSLPKYYQRGSAIAHANYQYIINQFEFLRAYAHRYRKAKYVAKQKQRR